MYLVRAAFLASLLTSAGVLSACSNTQAVATQQLVFANAQTVLTGANNAIADYGIAKGIAQIAELGLTVAGQSTASAAIASLVTQADATVGKLQTAVSAASIDLVSIQTLVAQINAQVQALRLQAAPAVQVAPMPITSVPVPAGRAIPVVPPVVPAMPSAPASVTPAS
jgi:hypothetical protein